MFVLQDRGYVSKEGRSSRLRAEPTGRLLVAYLMLYFPKYLDYGFTSGMEASLDDVSGVMLFPSWHASRLPSLGQLISTSQTAVYALNTHTLHLTMR